MKQRTLIGAGHAVKRARRDGDDPLSLESGDFSRPSHVIVRSEAETVVISLSPGENGSRASQTDGELGPAFNFDGACHEGEGLVRTHFINDNTPRFLAHERLDTADGGLAWGLE